MNTASAGLPQFADFAGTYSSAPWRPVRVRAKLRLRLGGTGSAEAHRTPSRRWRDELQCAKATRTAGNRASPPVAFFVRWLRSDRCASGGGGPAPCGVLVGLRGAATRRRLRPCLAWSGARQSHIQHPSDNAEFCLGGCLTWALVLEFLPSVTGVPGRSAGSRALLVPRESVQQLARPLP